MFHDRWHLLQTLDIPKEKPWCKNRQKPWLVHVASTSGKNVIHEQDREVNYHALCTRNNVVGESGG